MTHKREIVITGAGVVSPIGIGQEAFWASLCEGRSGVRKLATFADPDLVPFGGEVVDFDPKDYVRQRKSLKVMSRDIQLGFAAADLACIEARHHEHAIDPERLGIVFGDDMIPCELQELVPAYRSCIVDGRFQYNRWGEASMAEIFPLWMLKYLPNMPACHIGIAQDARG
ncbi:MAG: beta-ketoacyl synthase N-terminal-like domain-containing protein, partial [Thermoguttaceae bacterium]